MMRNLSVLAPIVSIFCLFFLSLLYHITLVASSTPPSYVPVVAITLDCGSATSATSIDRYGRSWTGDFKSKFFPKEELNLKSNTSQAPKEGIEIKAPYTTARISYSQFTYVFPLPDGPKFVRLHFNPVISSGVDGSKAFFTVKSGSFTLLRNFTASVSADSSQIVKEFCINVEENQKLNLTFIPFSTTTINFYAFINGIEIVSMPDELYYSPKGARINPSYVGQSSTFYIDYNMALEKIYRLNVGGSLIPPTEDTGMFREWSQVTEKTDVYSFGVVLLEVLCGRKAVNTKLGQEQLHLASWARKCIGNGTIYEIIDPYLKGKIAPECFKVYVEIAENCVRDQGIQRPTMNDVMERLEFALELQQNADTEQEKINPNGDITYQEVRSFRVSGSAGAVAPRQNNFHNIGPVLDSDTGNEPSTINSSESVTGASRDIFSDNPNTTT